MTLTKSDIKKGVHNRSAYPRCRSSELVESVLEIVVKALESGEDVLISGFGKFCVREKNSRMGRNPSSGEALVLGSKRVVTFKYSRVFKGKLNGKE